MTQGKTSIPVERLERSILLMRGQKVMLDADLARIYGVPTHRFNEAFKRNRHRFPEDFAFQLTADEFANLISQFAISSSEPMELQRNTANSSQFAMSSHRGHRYLPWAFTEHGVLMAANILRSRRAVEMSVFVVRAFVRMREQVAANVAILKRLAEIDQTLLEHDQALRVLWAKLQPLLVPPPPQPDPPRKQIGFQSRNRARPAARRAQRPGADTCPT